jgi:hypothetical protein
MKFNDLLSLAQSAAKILTASGALPGAAIVEAVSEIVTIVRRNVDEGAQVLAADEIGQLNTLLDQIHNRLMSLSDRLDRAATEAAKR